MKIELSVARDRYAYTVRVNAAKLAASDSDNGRAGRTSGLWRRVTLFVALLRRVRHKREDDVKIGASSVCSEFAGVANPRKYANKHIQRPGDRGRR